MIDDDETAPRRMSARGQIRFWFLKLDLEALKMASSSSESHVLGHYAANIQRYPTILGFETLGGCLLKDWKVLTIALDDDKARPLGFQKCFLVDVSFILPKVNIEVLREVQ